MKSTLPGVYMILNIITNKRYIGSATTPIAHRWYTHRYALRHNKHRNPHLQNAWNKYRETSFAFVVLENTASENVLEAEARWYETFKENGYELYNCKPGGQNSQLGLRHSQATKDKLHEILTGKKHNVSPEGREKIRQAKSHPMSPETIAKLARPFQLVSPSGEVVTGKNMTAFCEENGLDLSAIAKVQRGERAIYKGWRKFEEGDEPAPFRGKLRKVHAFYVIFSPEGTRYETSNMEAFGRDHGLDPKLLRETCRGKRRHHKGWTGTCEDYSPHPDRRIPPIPRTFIAPDGTVHTTQTGLMVFCKQHDLDNGAMHRVINGKQKNHKGWHLHTQTPM